MRNIYVSAQILVEPTKNGFDQFVMFSSHVMPGLSHDMLLLFSRSSQHSKQRQLRLLHGEHVIVASVHHQHRYLQPGEQNRPDRPARRRPEEVAAI